MSYLSDDEDNTDVNTDTIEPTFDELYPAEEEIDEEMMAIIKKHAYNKKDDDLIFPIKEKSKHKTDSIITDSMKENLKHKKNKTLDEYIKEEELKKPSKWSSSRADNKKKINDTEKSSKREFNPRLPPFQFLEKKKQTEYKVNTSEGNFPSLNK